MFEGTTISKRKHLTLGADPEIFLYSGLKLLPAFEFLPPKGKGVDMYYDGFQAEWKYDHEGNYCQNNLVLYTREKLMNLERLARHKDVNARLTLKNVVRIPRVTLETVRSEYVELGCQPSYNAYNDKGKPVYDPRQLPYRFAGGHMHFGTWNIRPNYEKIIKTLDAILGVWSVGVARNLDNPIRRGYYGLAGEYRKPKYAEGYGVEYRVLSNWWLASPALLQVTWDLGRLCVRLAASRHFKLWAGAEDETRDVINNCDFKRSEAIIQRNGPMFRWLLGQVYRKPENVQRAININQQGLEAVTPNPNDFANNWHYKDQWIKNGGQPWSRWEV